MLHAIADGANAPPDQGVSTFLLIGVALFGAVAYARWRGRAFTGLPRWVGWLSAGAAAACLVLAFVLPPIIRPVESTRPSSSATISFVTPTNGDVYHGDPAHVLIAVDLTGGTIVPYTSTHLVPNTGHIHLYLDGALILMSYSLNGRVRILPGTHTLRAEYVAVDHAPFNPPVLARVRFRVVA